MHWKYLSRKLNLIVDNEGFGLEYKAYFSGSLISEMGSKHCAKLCGIARAY